MGQSAARTNTLLLVVFFSAVAFVHTLPITDPDLFWHLASGRWIWEHKALPAADPFSFTSPADAYHGSSMAGVVSRQYWLAELIQYGAWRAAGYAGVVGLRVLLALLTLLAAYRGLRKTGLSVVVALLLLAPLGDVLAQFRGDRPNQMTFCFLAVSLSLIDDLKREPRDFAGAWRLPLLMLLWANAHGGFVLGAAVCIIHLLSELARHFATGRHRLNRPLCLALAVAVLAGSLNPNGYGVVRALAAESASPASIVTEFLSPFDVAHLGTRRYLVQFCGFVAAAVLALVVGVWTERRTASERSFLVPLARRVEQVALILAFGFLTIRALRVIPLLAIVCTPIIGGMVAGRPDAALRRLSRFLVPETALVCLVGAASWAAVPYTALRGRVVADLFPEPAVRFIERNRLESRIFNYYDWGGFLIWSFYPEPAVFIDGRVTSLRAYADYLAVIGGDRSRIAGKPVYQAVLDAYALNTVLIPGTTRNGGLIALIPLLEQDPQWKLVFTAKNCLLYARGSPLPALPKISAYGIARESALASLRDDPRPYLAVARADQGLGRWDDAAAFLAEALRRRPSLRGGPVEHALLLIRGGRDILREDTGLP